MKTFALLLLLPSALATVNWGSTQARDWKLQYAAGYYTHGENNSTMNFCKDWRQRCIDYVGARGYHHQLECQVDQAGPQIYTICAAVEKQANGDYGRGQPYDFTQQVVQQGKARAQIVAKPRQPIQPYTGA